MAAAKEACHFAPSRSSRGACRDLHGHSLVNAVAGSLRAAIQQANANPGADEIAFALAGSISLASVLPHVTGPVAIDGSTAPA